MLQGTDSTAGTSARQNIIYIQTLCSAAMYKKLHHIGCMAVHGSTFRTLQYHRDYFSAFFICYINRQPLSPTMFDDLFTL